jgi:hypothetical protein
MGIFPITVETGFGGGSTRFLHGTTNSGHTLNLGFENLTQSEAGLIRTHYRLQDGGHVAFALSSDAWAGHTSPTDLVPTTTLWCYDAQPQETHKSGGYIDMTITLRSVI